MFHSVDYISDLIATNFLVRFLRCLRNSSDFCFPSNFNLLSVFFSLAHGARRCSRPHNNPVENLVEESFFPAFLHFLAPKLSITFTIYNHFKTSIYLSRVKKKKKKKKKNFSNLLKTHKT